MQCLQLKEEKKEANNSLFKSLKQNQLFYRK